MNFNDFQQTVRTPQAAGLMTIALANPLAIALGATAIVTCAAIVRIQDMKKDNRKLRKQVSTLHDELETIENDYSEQPLKEPLNSAYEAVNSSAYTTVDQPFNLTVENNGSDIDEKAFKKELIRQAMSELGKRSAERRRHNNIS